MSFIQSVCLFYPFSNIDAVMINWQCRRGQRMFRRFCPMADTLLYSYIGLLATTSAL